VAEIGSAWTFWSVRRSTWWWYTGLAIFATDAEDEAGRRLAVQLYMPRPGRLAEAFGSVTVWRWSKC